MQSTLLMNPPQVKVQRRVLLLGGFAATTLSLSGCGFRLRGAVALPFDSIWIEGGSPFGVAGELSRQIAAQKNNLGVTRLATTAQSAQILMRVLTEAREKEVLGFSTSGSQRDYQLRLRFVYEILDSKRNRQNDPVQIVLRRNVNTVESQLTAKEQEDVVLFKEMQSDLVQQVLSRLRSVNVN